MSEMITNITTALTIAEQKGDIYFSKHSEEVYQCLREGIRSRYLELIQNGTPLVEIEANGDTFSKFIDNIDVESRRYYNCICCRTFMNTIDKIGYVSKDMTVHSPIQEIFQEVFKSYEAPAIKYVRPLSHVPECLTIEEKNGWTHFFAFTTEEASSLNKKLTAIDENFVNQWRITLSKLTMKAATLQKILSYLEEKLFNPAPISPLHPLIDIVKAIENKARNGLNTYDVIASHYRFPKWNWLSGVKSSSAGNVLTYLDRLTDGNTGSLSGLVSQLNFQADPIRHKRAVREASEQALKTDIDKLTEMGIPRALERAAVVPSDLDFIWSETSTKPEVICIDTPEGMTVTQKVMETIRLNRMAKAEGKDAASFLDTQISGLPVERCVSMLHFKELLPSFTKLSFISNPFRTRVYPVMLTKPVDDADYTGLFSENGGKSLGRSPSQTIAVRDLDPLDKYHGHIPFKNIYLHTNGMLIGQSEIGREFLIELIKTEGTMILGTDIHSNLKEHIRGWTEISKQIELQTTEEPFFTGIDINVGSNVVAVDANGTKYKIAITSMM